MSNTVTQFTISRATEADAEAVGQAHLQSWLETYPNAELGIDEQWIRDQVGFLAETEGNHFRRNSIRHARQPGSNTLYLVVRNEAAKIKGFLHVSRHKDYADFDAIYLTKEVQGTGVAHELMAAALKFAGELPMRLEVADYNQRAIKFYERYGFVRQPDPPKKHLHRDKIPIITMKREVKHEV
jgi:ribosomal protein S18 acetylase RimI-like enzyme